MKYTFTHEENTASGGWLWVLGLPQTVEVVVDGVPLYTVQAFWCPSLHISVTAFLHHMHEGLSVFGITESSVEQVL